MKGFIFWDRMPCGPLKAIDVSEEHVASIFTAEEQTRQETRVNTKATYSSKRPLLSADYTALYPRRLYSS
jgi:hypothetical protein